MTQILYTKDKGITRDFIRNKGFGNVPVGMFEDSNRILIIDVDNTSFELINKIMYDHFFKGGSDIILESDDFFINYDNDAVINRGLMLEVTN